MEDGLQVLSLERYILNRKLGDWQINVSGIIDFISFGPSLYGNGAIWSCIWKDFALLKIINEITGLIDLQIKHDKRIVKIYALDEIVALGDNEGKIMILETKLLKVEFSITKKMEIMQKKGR